MGAQSRPVILLTRPRPAAARFARALRHALAVSGAGQGDVRPQIVIAPLMQPRPIAAPRPHMLAGLADDAPLVVFTSAEGVAGFLRNWPEEAATGRLRALCVGPATERAARRAGFIPSRAAGGTAAALLDHLRGCPRGPVLVIRGREAAQDIAATLQAEGWPAEAAIVYAQEPAPLSPRARKYLAPEARVILPLFSPRSALLAAGALAADGQTEAPCKIEIVAISPAVLQVAMVLRPHISLVAKTPDANGMLAGVTHLLSTYHNTA
jgi:uroporphyrinogen-III synthase